MDLNSQEAGDLLGVKHFTLLTYARRGVIPGKIIGNEWRFDKSELLAWLNDVGARGADLEIALAGAMGFIQRMRLDSKFRQKVESLSTQAELIAFAKREGFIFTSEELKDALKVKPDTGLTEVRGEIVPRKYKRYQAVMEIFEVNGQSVTDTFILDFSNSGAKIRSLTPIDNSATIYIAFTLPGESKIFHISGRVVWSRFEPEEGHYHTGVEFFIPIDQLYREGKI